MINVVDQCPLQFLLESEESKFGLQNCFSIWSVIVVEKLVKKVEVDIEDINLILLSQGDHIELFGELIEPSDGSFSLFNKLISFGEEVLLSLKFFSLVEDPVEECSSLRMELLEILRLNLVGVSRYISHWRQILRKK